VTEGSKEARRPFRTAHLGDLERIDVAGVVFSPIRRRLGVRSFGINAFTATTAGQQVIEEHDETGSGSGRQEELYLVTSGRAAFTIEGEEVDAPAGTLVLVSVPEARRKAVAVEPGTTVVVVGGPADRRLRISPFEFWFAAEPAYRAGDYERAIQIVSEGLEEWPDHGVIHYQLACYHALAGHREPALHHLGLAVANEPRAATWAQSDSDLDSVRDAPDFARA
jgi:tetratricopeptide (TPR) repeat protein